MNRGGGGIGLGQDGGAGLPRQGTGRFCDGSWAFVQLECGILGRSSVEGDTVGFEANAAGVLSQNKAVAGGGSEPGAGEVFRDCSNLQMPGEKTRSFHPSILLGFSVG